LTFKIRKFSKIKTVNPVRGTFGEKIEEFTFFSFVRKVFLGRVSSRHSNL
jgi:hypothetical protein